MATVGHAYLKIMPSLEGLARELRGEVQRAERATPPAHVKVAVDRRSLRQLPGQITSSLRSVSMAGFSALGAQAGAGLAGGLASALATAGGSLGVVPAGLAALATSIGTAKLGLSGVGDALGALQEGDAEALAEAMGRLAPAARAAVNAVSALGDGFARMRLAVQETLFAGLAERIGDLGRAYLPMLTTGLSLVASGFNAAGQALADFLSSAQTQADVGTILLNVAHAVQALAPAVAPLASVVRDVAAVASDALPIFAAGATSAAESFARMVAAARDSGALQNWISAGLASLGQLASILGNVVRLIGAVVSAGQNVGSGLLAVINEITGKLAEFAASAQGQQALGSFFNSALQVARALLPVLTQIADIAGTVVAPALANLATSLLNSSGLQAFLNGLRDGLSTLGTAMPFVGQALGAILQAAAPLLPVLGQLAGQVLIALAQQFISLAPLIQPTVTAFRDFLVALLPLIPELSRISVVLLHAASVALPMLNTVLRWLTGIAPTVVGAMRAVADAFAATIGPIDMLRGAFDFLLRTMFGDVSQLPTMLAQKLNEFIGWWQTLPPRMREVITAVANLLFQPGVDLVTGLARGISAAWNGLVSTVRSLASGLVAQVKGIFQIHSPSRVFAEIGGNLTAGLTQGIARTAPLPVQAAGTLAAQVSGAAAVPVPGLPPAPRLATAPAAAGRPVTINVHPQPGQSEAAIAAMVSRRLAFDARL